MPRHNACRVIVSNKIQQANPTLLQRRVKYASFLFFIMPQKAHTTVLIVKWISRSSNGFYTQKTPHAPRNYVILKHININYSAAADSQLLPLSIILSIVNSKLKFVFEKTLCASTCVLQNFSVKVLK